MTAHSKADAIQIGGFETRSLHLDTRSARDGERTIRATFSSEDPYQRDWGIEILSHSREAVNMERASQGLSLLLHHDVTRIVGTAENIHLSDGKLKCTLRFGKSPEAETTWQDVVGGTLKYMSVGYHIDKLEFEGTNADGIGIYRATRWTPYEASIVAVPADATVGIGRSTSFHGKSKMTHVTPVAATAAPPPPSSEAERVAGILSLGRRFNVLDLAESAIREGATVADFNGRLLDNLSRLQSGNPPTSASGRFLPSSRSESDLHKSFSLGKAIAAAISGNWDNAGLEREVSQDLAKRSGRTPQGMYVPSMALMSRAAMTVGNSGSLVGTELAENLFVESLTPITAVLAAGATKLNGLVGDVSIPRRITSPSAAWSQEDTTITEGASTFGNINMNPKQCSARVSYSKKLLVQSMPGIENLMRDDISRQIALAIDAAAIKGAGASNEPQGILSTTGIGLVSLGTNGAAPTWDMVVDLVKEVAIDNALDGSLAYIGNTSVMTKMQKTPKQSSGVEGNFILGDATDRLNGFKAFWSNQMPANLTKGSGTNLSATIFGNWADLLIGEWGALDIIVDPFSDGPKGNVRIYAHAFVDIVVRRAQSFAACVDIIT